MGLLVQCDNWWRNVRAPVGRAYVIKGFKEFILRGNVIDLAVAVVIGAAFTAVVDSIVNGLINPLIAMLFDAEELSAFKLGPFEVGSIIGALITFLAVATVVYFVFVYPMNRAKAHLAERRAGAAGASEAPEVELLPSEQELLAEIRDLLQKQAK